MPRCLCLPAWTVLVAGAMVCADARRSFAQQPAPTPERTGSNSSDEPAEPPPGHLEAPDQPPSQTLRDRPPGRSQGARPTTGVFSSVQVNVDAGGLNILGDAANEPSIAVDPTNPNRIAIGWRQFFDVTSNFRQAGWAFSTDGGQTWTNGGSLEPGEFSSDPVLDFDANGNFYYYGLQPNRGPGVWACYLYKSFDGGNAWPQEVYAFGGDKAWITVDRTGGVGDGNVYIVWSPFASCCSGLFTRSTDGGLTFDNPVSVPGFSFAAHLTVAPSGAVYVVGASGNNGTFQVLRSNNAQFAGNTPTFDLVQNVDLGGTLTLGTGPNPAGLLGQPWIAADRSGGPNDGHLYLLASVNPPGSDPLDVMIIRSEDGGQTWSTPVRVNDDASPGSWQWFGTMSVAPNGRIDVVWLDSRESGNSRLSRLYYAHSLDGGRNWSANRPVSPEFDSFLGFPQQNKIGDYYEMISDDDGASLAYAATFNGEQDVYYLRIPNPDCNSNGVLDACDVDCGPPGGPCDVPGCGASSDCNFNTVPDECEPNDDCNANGVRDICDIGAGTSDDCNGDIVPDECPGCTSDCECVVPDPCAFGVCVAGSCQSAPGIYGDLDRNNAVNLFDLFCILDALSGQFEDCAFDDVDIEPCAGNGTINVFDLFALLDALAGVDACCSGP